MIGLVDINGLTINIGDIILKFGPCLLWRMGNINRLERLKLLFPKR